MALVLKGSAMLCFWTSSYAVTLSASAATAVLLLSTAINVSAQELNRRTTLSPGAAAGQAQAIARTRAEVSTLRSRDTVSTDCNDVNIGIQEEDDERNLADKLGDNEIIITGSVIVLCDH